MTLCEDRAAGDGDRAACSAFAAADARAAGAGRRDRAAGDGQRAAGAVVAAADARSLFAARRRQCAARDLDRTASTNVVLLSTSTPDFRCGKSGNVFTVARIIRYFLGGGKWRRSSKVLKF
ncbi:MAG: hypothetical protein GX174_13135 [Lentisphaerae bacterium]|nr:hypothetical protein [Lentisphaerota bacterium]